MIIKCSDTCVPLCDFCVYFDFNKLNPENSYCVLNKTNKRLEQECNNFNCFNKLDLTNNRHQEVNYRLKENRYKVISQKLNDLKRFCGDPNDIIFKKVDWMIKILNKRIALMRILKERLINKKEIPISEYFDNKSESYIEDLLKMDNGEIR